MAEILQIRGGTAAEWTTANPILAHREMGIEIEIDVTIPNKIKIGNGINDWNTLPYFMDGNNGNNILIECEIGQTPILTPDTITVTGLYADNPVIYSPEFVGKKLRIFRGGGILPQIAITDGSDYFTKSIESDTATLSTNLVPGEYIRIETF